MKLTLRTAPHTPAPRRQFSLKTLLAAVTWASLVIAICVGQQRAAVRQRLVLEQLKGAGLLPTTTIGGQPWPASVRNQPPAQPIH